MGKSLSADSRIEEADSIRSGLNHRTLLHIAPSAPEKYLNCPLARRCLLSGLNEKFSRSTFRSDGHSQQATRFQAGHVSYAAPICCKASDEFSSPFGVLVKF